MRKFTALAAAALPLSGCFLLNQDIEVPLELTSPPQEIDVDGPVAESEATACVTPGAPSCATLTAICNTEDGRNCTPPTMPNQFPQEIDVGGNTVTADQAIQDMGMGDACKVELALPVPVGGQLKDAGVEDTSAIKNVTIDSVQVEWPENSLSFDSPPIDVYLANEALEEGIVDAQALIDDGKVEKIGTIASQPAGSTDPANLEFVSGGKDKFSEAVKSAEFTLVTKGQDAPHLKEVAGTDPVEVRKPSGKAKMQMKAVLKYSVSAADVVQ